MPTQDFAVTILRNSLIDFMTNDLPFSGRKCAVGDHWRYFFGANTNQDQQEQILLRPNVKRTTALAWSQARRREAGNPRVTWLVSKWLSTTTLVITDWETHSVWWDIHASGTLEAKALTDLAIHNGVFADWTVVQDSQSVVAANS